MAGRLIPLLKNLWKKKQWRVLAWAVLGAAVLWMVHLPFTRVHQLASVQLDSSWAGQTGDMATKNMEKKDKLIKRLYPAGTPQAELIADLKSLHYSEQSGGPCPVMAQPAYGDRNDIHGPAMLAIRWCSDGQGNISTVSVGILETD